MNWTKWLQCYKNQIDQLKVFFVETKEKIAATVPWVSSSTRKGLYILDALSIRVDAHPWWWFQGSSNDYMYILRIDRGISVALLYTEHLVWDYMLNSSAFSENKQSQTGSINKPRKQILNYSISLHRRVQKQFCVVWRQQERTEVGRLSKWHCILCSSLEMEAMSYPGTKSVYPLVRMNILVSNKHYSQDWNSI